MIPDILSKPLRSPLCLLGGKRSACRNPWQAIQPIEMAQAPVKLLGNHRLFAKDRQAARYVFIPSKKLGHAIHYDSLITPIENQATTRHSNAIPLIIIHTFRRIVKNAQVVSFRMAALSNQAGLDVW